jgi:hypothetical protein
MLMNIQNTHVRYSLCPAQDPSSCSLSRAPSSWRKLLEPHCTRSLSHKLTCRPVPQAAGTKRSASSTKAKKNKRASKAAAAAGSSKATKARTSAAPPAHSEKQLMAVAQAAIAHMPIPALPRPAPQPGELSRHQQRRSRHSDSAARWAGVSVREAGVQLPTTLSSQGTRHEVCSFSRHHPAPFERL